MKKVLYLLIVILLAVGCSKDDPVEPYPDERHTVDVPEEDNEELPEEPKEDPLTQFFEEYGLSNKFEKPFEDVRMQNLNDSLIYFTGKLKDSDNIGLVISHKNTKKKLIDIVPYENNTVMVDKPYEGRTSVEINDIYCLHFYQTEDFIFIHILGSGDEETSVYSDVFINNNRIINSTNIYGHFVLTDIIEWKQNLMILYGQIGYLYSATGELLIKTNSPYIYTLKHLSQDEILSDYEVIIIQLSNHRIYSTKIDLRDESVTFWWYSAIEFDKSNQLNEPRIDEKKLIERTDTHISFEISYTEISGTKGKFKIKVNIETGEMEYL